jgi:hypothetical protein
MPFNPNPPAQLGPLPKSTSRKPWPYNPNPQPQVEWVMQGYSDARSQAEEYSWLANRLYRMSIEWGMSPVWFSTTPERIFNQLRAARLLPAYPGRVSDLTVIRLRNFTKRTLFWAQDLKLSRRGLESIIIGESP